VEISDLPTPGKVTYEPTLKEKERAFIKAITAMEVCIFFYNCFIYSNHILFFMTSKEYRQYSFEELRFCCPFQSKTLTETLTATELGNLLYFVIIFFHFLLV
jgi:hypothetical protein